MASRSITVTALAGIPLVEPGDDLAGILLEGLEQTGLDLRAGDVLVLAQKIVSKAEGRYRTLAEIEAGADALMWAHRTGKDPRLVQAILDESTEVLRHRENLLIVEHRLGHVAANAGIDQSNIDHRGGARILLLPEDPDASAARLATTIRERTGAAIGIVISDSIGRPWRTGTVGVAIGAAGVRSVDDIRGAADLHGRPLMVSVVGHADQIASAASLVIGEAAEATPVAHIRGLPLAAEPLPAASLNRPRDQDLFR